VATPYNEYVTESGEEPLERALGWYPPVPTSIQSLNGRDNLVTQVGQFNPSAEELRLYSSLAVDIYYSNSSDRTPPQVTVIDGIFNSSTSMAEVKVGTADASGVREVLATYIVESVTPPKRTGRFHSVNLRFDPASQKWVGSFPAVSSTRFFVQIVDQAGNVAVAANKGRNYALGVRIEGCSPSCPIYLPMVVR
jgi:hypothetical protein